MKKQITLYDAIAKMRQISKAGGEFSIVFMSYSKSRGKSDGVVSVPHARLRAQTSAEIFDDADFMLNCTNNDTDALFQFYQPTLMYFNGMKVEL